MIENALVSRLLATVGVTAIIVDRIDPWPLPQNPTLPALTILQTSGARIHNLTGSAGLAKPTFQIDCWGRKKSEVQDLAEEVRLSLQGFRGVIGSDNIQAILMLDQLDFWEDEDQVRRTTLEFEVWHCETVPP